MIPRPVDVATSSGASTFMSGLDTYDQLALDQVRRGVAGPVTRSRVNQLMAQQANQSIANTTTLTPIFSRTQPRPSGSPVFTV